MSIQTEATTWMRNSRYIFLCFVIALSLIGRPAFASEEFRVVASVKPVHSILSGLM